MATTIYTQDIIDAKRDIDDIGKAVNEKVIVSPRYGEDFKSLPMISAEAQATVDGWQDAINTITVNDGIPALAVSDASGENQQEINDIVFKDFKTFSEFSLSDREFKVGDIVSVGSSLLQVVTTDEDYTHPITEQKYKYVVAADNVIDLVDVGAPDDLTTPINDLVHKLISRTTAAIRFPKRFAIAGTLNLYGLERRFIFPESYMATLAGMYDDVLIYGSNADTGMDAVISLGTAGQGCVRCNFEGNLRWSSNTSGNTDLVLFSAKQLGSCFLNQFPLVVHVPIGSPKYVFYGQRTTVAVAGSFTGSRINFIETGNGVGAFFMDQNQDDVVFGIIRDRGRSVVRRSLSVESYFLRGTSLDRDGIILESGATLICDHLFIEGEFRYPILFNAPNCGVKANLRVSVEFVSTHMGVVYSAQPNTVVDFHCEGEDYQGSHTHFVTRWLTNNQVGTVKITTGRPFAEKTPVVVAGGDTTAYSENIEYSCKEGIYRGTISNKTVYWVSSTLNPRKLIHRLPDGSEGAAALHARRVVALSADIQINLDTPQASVIELNPSTAGITLGFYAAYYPYGGEVTLINVSAHSINLSSSFLKLSGGGTYYVLPANGNVALTLIWSHTLQKWVEKSRTVLSS